MLTYKEIAHALGIPRGTLNRKLLVYNQQVADGKQPGPAVLPDKVEDKGNYEQYLFAPTRLDAIRQALKLVTSRGRGRPRNPPR